MSIKESIIEEAVRRLAAQVAEDQGVEPMEVKLFGKGKRTLLKITIDKSNGVTLDDCERFSRAIERLIETEDILEGPYNLEVSSPGIDRPLTAQSDFERNNGKLVRVITKEKIDNQNFFSGRIIGITHDSVRLLVGKKERDIPFENISKARLEIEIR